MDVRKGKTVKEPEVDSGGASDEGDTETGRSLGTANSRMSEKMLGRNGRFVDSRLFRK